MAGPLGASDRTFWTPNPIGPLADGFERVARPAEALRARHVPVPERRRAARRPPARLHRHRRLRPLPAHDAATTCCTRWATTPSACPPSSTRSQTGQHPRVTTEANIANMRRQLRALGPRPRPAPRASPPPTSGYYRWTQWIFLQIFDSWYDADADRARPIAELVAELEAGTREPVSEANPDGRPWAELDDADPPTRSSTRTGSPTSTRRRSTGARRSAPCSPTRRSPPTAAASAATIPVFRRPLKQWMLRITAYADRLLDDLDLARLARVDQARCSATGSGAARAPTSSFPVEGHDDVDIEVFTTRPDTLFGATYMVLAPEHPLVDEIVADRVARRRRRRWSGAAPSASTSRRRRRSRRTASSRREDGARAPGRGPGEDRRLHRRVRRSTPSTASASRSSSPTTC